MMEEYEIWEDFNSCHGPHSLDNLVQSGVYAQATTLLQIARRVFVNSLPSRIKKSQPKKVTTKKKNMHVTIGL